MLYNFYSGIVENLKKVRNVKINFCNDVMVGKYYVRKLNNVEKLTIKCYSKKNLECIKKCPTPKGTYDVRIELRTEFKVHLFTREEFISRQDRLMNTCPRHRFNGSGSSDEETSDEESLKKRAPEKEAPKKEAPKKKSADEDSSDDESGIQMAPDGILKLFIQSLNLRG